MYFPKKDPTPEDKLRSESIRSNFQFTKKLKEESENLESFYRNLCSEIKIKEVESDNPRLIEMLEKTNQFNMNGIKTIDPKVQYYLVDYTDCHGALGWIAAFGIHKETLNSKMNNLVQFCLSCRAFDRRVEYQILDWLFDKYYFLCFKYIETPKNIPFQNFLSKLGILPNTNDSIQFVGIARADFYTICPPLYTIPECDAI
jgi:FkbH-like protein